MPSFVLYARVLTAHSLRRNCPKLWRSEWAVGIPTRGLGLLLKGKAG